MASDLREVFIPRPHSSKSALNYHDVPIDLASMANREDLVDVRTFNIAARSAYHRADAPYYRAFPSALPEVYVRESVARMLAHVKLIVREYGAEPLCWDGYRPIELQRDLWQHFLQKGREALVNPSEQQLVEFAGQFCSNPTSFDPNDPRTWPVHNTGGAIDLTLRSLETGEPLFMGSIYDDASSISKARFFEEKSNLSQSEFEARRNRRLLYHAMVEAGFVNYPFEWWHYDFGTQMWVMNGNRRGPALYGRYVSRAAAA